MAERKNKPSIVAPHDHYFKMAMSDHRVAREFFETHLPEDVLSIIELEYLTLQPVSYIDDMRQEAIADMVFKTKIMDQDAFIYLVADHQSVPDRLMPFRVHKYITNIIDQYLKSSKDKAIPLVIPLVVYHGKKPWNYSTDIKDLVAAPRDLTDKFFLKPFQLIDLNNVPDEVLKKKIWTGVMELTLKYVYGEMIFHLHDIIALLKRVERLGGASFVEVTLVYLVDTSEVGDKKAFIDLVKKEMSAQTVEKIMTIAEQFRAEGKHEGWQEGKHEGWQEGKQEGRQEERLQTAARMLSEGIEIDLVAKITQLPIEYLDALVIA